MNTKKSKKTRVVVPPEMSGWRLDRILSHLLPEWSRKDVGELIVSDSIIHTGEVLRKGTQKITEGSRLDIDTAQLYHLDKERKKLHDVSSFAYTGDVSAVVPENIPLDIVYEDRDMLVVDKPAGMVIHPAYANTQGTLANALAGYFKRKGIPVMRRIGLVHRLDKDVSGLIFVAKSDIAMESLSKQFSSEGISHGTIDIEHKVWKYYRAFVQARTSQAIEKSGLRMGKRVLVEGWIKRSEKDRRLYTFQRYSAHNAVNASGKYAASYMTLLSHNSGEYEILVQIITGRTHQIRVQLSSVGLPIVGDKLYGTGGGYIKLRCEMISFIRDWLPRAQAKGPMIDLAECGRRIDQKSERVSIERRGGKGH